MPSRTWLRTLCRTTKRLKAVRPAVMSTMESRKRVRRRVRGTRVLPDGAEKVCATGSDEGAKAISANELVTHSVHSAEVYRTGRVALQLLAKLQDMVVDGAGGRIILVSPDLVQQFVPADDAVGILHQKLQGLKFLSSQDYDLALALDFHFLEVDRDTVETHE